MAKSDLAGPSGSAQFDINEQEIIILRNAVRLYVQSKKRQCNGAQGDGDLYPIFHGQMVQASQLLMKFGG